LTPPWPAGGGKKKRTRIDDEEKSVPLAGGRGNPETGGDGPALMPAGYQRFRKAAEIVRGGDR